MMKGLSFPSNQMLQEFAVNVPDLKEITWQPLYDILPYPTTGALQFNFFQRQIGASGATLADTNMLLASAVPRGQSFLMTGIEVFLIPAFEDLSVQSADAATAFPPLAVEEFYKIMTGKAALQLSIGQKPYAQVAPLLRCSQGQSVQANMTSTVSNTTASTITSGSNGLPWVSGRPFDIVPLLLPANQNFGVQILFDSLITVTTAARLGVVINGYQLRQAQ